MTRIASRLTPEDEVKLDALLQSAPVAYLGSAAAEIPGVDDAAVDTPGGWPYVVPVNFAYERPAAAPALGRGRAAGTASEAGCPPETGPATACPTIAGPNPATDRGRLLFHTGEGVKTRAFAADPRVCLAITGGLAYSQGSGPCDDGFAFKSVLVWGRAVRLEGREESEQALRAIVAKYDPGAASAPFDERVLSRTLIYAVTIEALSYKERPRPWQRPRP